MLQQNVNNPILLSLFYYSFLSLSLQLGRGCIQGWMQEFIRVEQNCECEQREKKFLLLFKGEKNLFFRCGQDHLLSITSDFNLCPKRRGGGGPGGRVPLLGCSGVQDDYNCPPPCVHYNGTSRERLPLHVSASRCIRGYHSKLVYHMFRNVIWWM